MTDTSVQFTNIFPFVTDLDLQEAQALYDFQGRTDRELSFKKGDSLIVYEKVSADWWEGAIGDREGLLPDKYIAVRPRWEDNSNLAILWIILNMWV